MPTEKKLEDLREDFDEELKDTLKENLKPSEVLEKTGRTQGKKEK